MTKNMTRTVQTSQRYDETSRNQYQQALVNC